MTATYTSGPEFDKFDCVYGPSLWSALSMSSFIKDGAAASGMSRVTLGDRQRPTVKVC